MSSETAIPTVPAAPQLPPLPPARPRRGHPRLVGALVALVVIMPVLAGGLWLRVHPAPQKLVVIHRATPGGSFPWSNTVRTTAPSAQFAVFAQQNNPVDPAFQTYYTRENGPVLLGNALTPAYPTRLGWVQIFANGALIAPAQNGGSSAGEEPEANDLDPTLLHNGKFDSATGIVRLPLLDPLLSAGSQIPLGGADSDLTYVSLRDATAPSHLVRLQTSIPLKVSTPTKTAQGVFIAQSTSHGVASGHTVPLKIWSYITSSKVSPDDWEDTFGDPLTEGLPATATINGAPHHLLVQAFTLALVAVDLDADNGQGQPTGEVLPLGRDYLETLGPPPVVVPTGTTVWLTGTTALAKNPGGGSASAHLGINFPLALSGQAQWIGGALWYQASWQSPHRSGGGWTAANMVTLKSPAKGAASWASFDALSPDIANYLAGFGVNVASVVYDLTRNRYYTYNEATPFVLGSSSKVSLMLEYLSWIESQGRSPNAAENTTMVNMIEHSDNNAAELIYDSLGFDAGMRSFYQQVGVTGYISDPSGWGWGQLPPIGQVQLLTLLQQGKILNAQDRAYALNLMSHVESDQRMGVGVTLPPGATVAMKDGWVPAQDGLWAINTSGIVTAGKETYIIVVYTQHQADYYGAWDITQHVCKTVGLLLV